MNREQLQQMLEAAGQPGSLISRPPRAVGYPSPERLIAIKYWIVREVAEWLKIYTPSFWVRMVWFFWSSGHNGTDFDMEIGRAGLNEVIKVRAYESGQDTLRIEINRWENGRPVREHYAVGGLRHEGNSYRVGTIQTAVGRSVRNIVLNP